MNKLNYKFVARFFTFWFLNHGVQMIYVGTMHYEQMQLSGTCSSSLGLICNFLIHFLELQHIFNLGLHQQQQRKKQSTGYRRATDWSFKNGMTLLPSLIKKKDHFVQRHAKSIYHFVQKYNVVTQKMNIVCNYKVWRLHCLILNLREQYAKHSISWRGKV